MRFSFIDTLLLSSANIISSIKLCAKSPFILTKTIVTFPIHSSHLCHNNVAIKHTLTLRRKIGKFSLFWIGDFAVHCYFENHCKNGLTYKPSLCRFTATKDANLLAEQQDKKEKHQHLCRKSAGGTFAWVFIPHKRVKCLISTP